MEHRKSTHCTNKYTHWMCVMRHCLYNILQERGESGEDSAYEINRKAGKQDVINKITEHNYILDKINGKNDGAILDQTLTERN